MYYGPPHPSVENNSGGTLENNSSVENNSGGTLENLQLVLYVQSTAIIQSTVKAEQSTIQSTLH